MRGKIDHRRQPHSVTCVFSSLLTTIRRFPASHQVLNNHSTYLTSRYTSFEFLQAKYSVPRGVSWSLSSPTFAILRYCHDYRKVYQFHRHGAVCYQIHKWFPECFRCLMKSSAILSVGSLKIGRPLIDFINYYVIAELPQELMRWLASSETLASAWEHLSGQYAQLYLAPSWTKIGVLGVCTHLCHDLCIGYLTSWQTKVQAKATCNCPGTLQLYNLRNVITEESLGMTGHRWKASQVQR